jgi:hypothetical protein
MTDVDTSAAPSTVVSADGTELSSLPRTCVDYLIETEKDFLAVVDGARTSVKSVKLALKQKHRLDATLSKSSRVRKARATRTPNHKPVQVIPSMIKFMNDNEVSGDVFTRPQLLKTVHGYIKKNKLSSSKTWTVDDIIARVLQIQSGESHSLIKVNGLIQKAIIRPDAAATATASS